MSGQPCGWRYVSGYRCGETADAAIHDPQFANAHVYEAWERRTGKDRRGGQVAWPVPEPETHLGAFVEKALAAAPQAAPADGALREALGLFRSVIQSGEPWTETCQRAYDRALAAADAVPERPVRCSADHCDKEWWHSGPHGPADAAPERTLPSVEELTDALEAALRTTVVVVDPGEPNVERRTAEALAIPVYAALRAEARQ